MPWWMLHRHGMFKPTLLTLFKVYLTPIVMQEIMRLVSTMMHSTNTDAAARLNISNDDRLKHIQSFIFIYGGLPAAPSTIVIANQYGLGISSELSASVLLATVAWGPLTFAGYLIVNADTADVLAVIDSTSEVLNVCSATAVCVIMLGLALDGVSCCQWRCCSAVSAAAEGGVDEEHGEERKALALPKELTRANTLFHFMFWVVFE